jgi:hypothetical protein
MQEQKTDKTRNTYVKYFRMQRLNQVLKEYRVDWETRCVILGEYFALKPNAVSIAINCDIPSDIDFEFLSLDESWIRARMKVYFRSIDASASGKNLNTV